MGEGQATDQVDRGEVIAWIFVCPPRWKAFFIPLRVGGATKIAVVSNPVDEFVSALYTITNLRGSLFPIVESLGGELGGSSP